MQIRVRTVLLILAASFVAEACSFSSGAQQAGPGAKAATSSDPLQAAPGGALKNGVTQSNSSSRTLARTQRQTATEQIKEQEQQRVVGILPEFDITYHWDAAAMTAGQKMRLAFRSTTDPHQFAAAFLVAGYHEALWI